MHRLTLAFNDRSIEDNFSRAYFEESLNIGRFCHILSVFFYFMMYVWDIKVVNPDRAEAWKLVIVVIALMFTAGFLLSYLEKPFYSRFWKQIYVIYSLISGSGLALITARSGIDFPYYNFVGIIYTLIFCYVLIRQTFIWSAIAGNLIVLIYTAALFFSPNAPRNDQISQFFFISGVNVLGMLSNFSRELLSRRRFTLDTLLNRERERANCLNENLEKRVRERTEELEDAFTRESLLAYKLEQGEQLARLGYLEMRGESYFWSPGLFHLLGLKDGDISPKAGLLEQFVHREDKDDFASKMNRNYRFAQSFEWDFRIHTKQGDLCWIHGLVEHMNSGSKMTRCIFQDITASVQTRDNMELLQNQLIQSRKMESLGQLAGGVAHDFNNITSIIMGYSELALEEIGKDSPIESYLNEILNGAVRAGGITKQLLAFARKQTIKPKRLSLNKTIDGMMEMLNRFIGENILLEWQPGDDTGNLVMDPSQLDQIITNLILNARDAIEFRGKILLTSSNVSLSRGSLPGVADVKPGKYIQLDVRDNGKGMARETRERIFEPFFTTKELGKGTGLGLATIFGIVSQNEGYITVDSEVGRGTVFSVYFPRDKDDFSAVLPEGDKGIPKGKGERILFVEDERAILDVGRKILNSLEYKVFPASSAREALEIVENEEEGIELLVTDVIMPDMNGRELSETLKKRGFFLKTLYISGYTSDIITHRGILDEGINFLPKPFTRETLARKIRLFLDV